MDGGDILSEQHIARVSINGKDLGVIWTAPWSVRIPAGLLKPTGNTLAIEVTNVWANRMIGDDQEPDDCQWLPNMYFYYSGKYLKEFPDYYKRLDAMEEEAEEFWEGRSRRISERADEA